MDFLSILAGATETGTAAISSVVNKAYETFTSVVGVFLPVIIGVVLLFGVVYGILLGIKFAKAEDTEARDKAKSQLINMVIGVLVALVIAVIVFALLRGKTVKNLFTNNNQLTIE